MKPTNALLLEERFPINVAWFHARSGRMTAIVKRYGPALRVPDLGEIEADAIDFADAVVLSRDCVRNVHSDCPRMIGDDITHRRRIQSTDPAGPQAQPRKCIRYVVLTATNRAGGERRIMHSPSETKSNLQPSAGLTFNPIAQSQNQKSHVDC
jgi:hypothetical protein